MNRKINSLLILFLLASLQLSFSQASSTVKQNNFRRLDSLIVSGKFGKINSLIIVKNDSLLFEKYYNGFTRDSLQNLYSVTKSVTSLLFGVAAKQFLLPDLETPIYKFFPEYRLIFDRTPAKKKIKLIHLFTMTAGLDWEEFKGYPNNFKKNYKTTGRFFRKKIFFLEVRY